MTAVNKMKILLYIYILKWRSYARERPEENRNVKFSFAEMICFVLVVLSYIRNSNAVYTYSDA